MPNRIVLPVIIVLGLCLLRVLLLPKGSQFSEFALLKATRPRLSISLSIHTHVPVPFICVGYCANGAGRFTEATAHRVPRCQSSRTNRDVRCCNPDFPSAVMSSLLQDDGENRAEAPRRHCPDNDYVGFLLSGGGTYSGGLVRSVGAVYSPGGMRSSAW